MERLTKGKEYHQNVSLHYLQKDKGHIKVNVVYWLKHLFIIYSSVTSDKRLRTKDSNIDDDEDNLSDTQGTSSEQSLSHND